MGNRFLLYRILIVVILLGLSTLSFAQIYAPSRDWADTTKYTKVGVQQDSIFVFFSPKKGNLKARFSSSLPVSNFKWFKYDDSKPLTSRFVEFYNENGVSESSREDLDGGGYKVSIFNPSDTLDYFCWVMIDSVKITNLEIYNECDFLEVITKTSPSTLSLRNGDYFRYWDFKSSTTIHRENNKFGDDYFKNIVWHASSSQVTVPQFSLLTLTIGDPAPLYDSNYGIKITNPFGRLLSSETDLIVAKAAKADFTLYVDKDGNNTWEDGGSSPSGEALLRLKFNPKSINADSIYWQILNDEKLFKKDGDSIIWNQGYKFSEGTEIIPGEELVPGTFPVEHIAYNVSSGCRDTMTIYVEVDSSSIKPDAIPNVFSPNGDGVNDFFLIKEAKTNVTSIKTFKVLILSRQGLLIYSFSGNPKEWEGWDGRMSGSKRDAPEGIYYFIIEAKGWDDRLFKRGPYKGFLYLYRGDR